jgi:hypothetical protein
LRLDVIFFGQFLLPMKYAPVGRCIYCGASNVPLSLEHIVPEALDGPWELPDASCRACMEKINKYEHTVGRTIFGDFRIKHGLRSKRPKSHRPNEIKINLSGQDGAIAHKIIDRKEYPAPLFLYKFGRATLLRGLPANTGIFDFVPYVIVDEKEMKRFHKKYGDALFRLKVVPNSLARMLAKIGYAYAVAELTLDCFYPLQHTLDVILCKNDDVGWTVGGKSELAPRIENAGHMLKIDILSSPPAKPLIVTEIRLFSMMDTPDFHVVVGRMDFRNPKHVLAFQKHARDAQRIESFGFIVEVFP